MNPFSTTIRSKNIFNKPITYIQPLREGFHGLLNRTWNILTATKHILLQFFPLKSVLKALLEAESICLFLELHAGVGRMIKDDVFLHLRDIFPVNGNHDV